MIQEQINIQPLAAYSNETVIDIKGLYKSFGDNNDVLKGVDIIVTKGENLVVLGKSGSGKSVTIKCLVGLVEADEGVIKVFDTDISNLDNSELNVLRVRIAFHILLLMNDYIKKERTHSSLLFSSS